MRWADPDSWWATISADSLGNSVKVQFHISRNVQTCTGVLRIFFSGFVAYQSSRSKFCRNFFSFKSVKLDRYQKYKLIFSEITFFLFRVTWHRFISPRFNKIIHRETKNCARLQISFPLDFFFVMQQIWCRKREERRRDSANEFQSNITRLLQDGIANNPNGQRKCDG